MTSARRATFGMVKDREGGEGGVGGMGRRVVLGGAGKMRVWERPGARERSRGYPGSGSPT